MKHLCNSSCKEASKALVSKLQGYEINFNLCLSYKTANETVVSQLREFKSDTCNSVTRMQKKYLYLSYKKANVDFLSQVVVTTTQIRHVQLVAIKFSAVIEVSPKF